jgi:hypothetical protein
MIDEDVDEEVIFVLFVGVVIDVFCGEEEVFACMLFCRRKKMFFWLLYEAPGQSVSGQCVSEDKKGIPLCL